MLIIMYILILIYIHIHTHTHYHTGIHKHTHTHMSMLMCESEYVHENRQKYFGSSSAQNTVQMPTLQYGRLVFPDHA